MSLLHLQREIDVLNRLILQLGGRVEQNLRTGIQSIQNRNPEQGESLREEDRLVDDLEVRVEEECLKILALHQPVASDLRYIVALMKINNDLERIGDLSENLGKRSALLSRQSSTEMPPQIGAMSALAREMLRKSLEALIHQEIDASRRILKQDRQMDQLNSEVYDWFKTRVQETPAEAGCLLNLLLTARDLERIADHVCNIAEDVIYLVSGEIVRHLNLMDSE